MKRLERRLLVLNEKLGNLLQDFGFILIVFNLMIEFNLEG